MLELSFESVEVIEIVDIRMNLLNNLDLIFIRIY